jgi:ribosomal-protein-alanine N-acetyltransferase
MKTIIETERLILRELDSSDLNGMFELDSNPEVHKYLGNNPIIDKKQLVKIIELVRQQYLDNGIGRWAIIEKKTGNFVGWSGLKLVKETINNHYNYYDLGYRLVQNYWGKGYASESAKAALDYGFSTLQLNEIFAAAHVDNLASNRILTKLGFQKEEIFYYETELCNWYKMVSPTSINKQQD